MKIYAIVFVGVLVAAPALAQETWDLNEGNVAEKAGQLVTWLLGISGGAAWIAATFKDSGILKMLMPLINLIGGNVGAAKNDPAKN